MSMKNIIFKSFNFLIAVSLLSGCGLYNKYERPEVDTKGLVRDTVSITDTLAVADTTTFGNLPWRSVFTDPQLQALIQQGLDNSKAANENTNNFFIIILLLLL